ncbi:MAG: preprotein translocase subunit SecE [Acidobacteriota bacterium]|nr:preprotein translocase subunit SecE [Acidobacteriota bacterium]
MMLEKVKDAPRNLITFYGDVKTELKKVTWPRKKEVYATTVIVIITVFFFGIYLYIVDFFLQNIVQRIFGMFQ